MKKNQSDFLQIGEIYREHGVKGFCKAYIYSGDDDNLDVGKKYLLALDDAQKRESKLLSVSCVGRYFLLHFDIFQSPEEARLWRKAGIWVKKVALKKLSDEMYDFQWQGFTVYDDHKTCVGVIKEVEYTPMRQFLVTTADGTERLIPYQQEWIVKKDDTKKTLIMQLPEGILEL